MHFLKALVLLVPFISAPAQNYFQQQVSYKINAELKPSEQTLSFNSIMNYKNNSPDTLKEIFIRLHWNIYRNDSYANILDNSNRLIESGISNGVEINSVELNNNAAVYFIDNTIMKIPLETFLLPGESLELSIEASAVVPETPLRMGRSGRDYAIAHWYPAVCVYDKQGWQIDQYLGQGEFNEEMGNYEISLTIPKSYLVYSTGYLINPEEVLPAQALSKLEEAKSSDTHIRIYDQTLEPVEQNDSLKITWKFKGDSVRTFAFAAFENRIWEAQSYNGIIVNSVFQKSEEEYYKTEGIQAAVHAVKYFSENVGWYPYPNVYTVSTDNIGGGMEYPGITFIGPVTGSLYGRSTSMTIIHEIAHNWFPMIVNSNETKYAFMDEGFVEFWTMTACEQLYGKENNLLDLSGILKLIIPPVGMSNRNYYTSVYNQVNMVPEPIIRHSDRYISNNNYAVNVYFKTSRILIMLKYVMGDEAFADLNKEYFHRYQFKHVNPDDFFSLAEEIHYKYNRKKDLSWFFDQWFYKTAKLDYSLDNFDYSGSDGNYKSKVTVRRIEDAIMPCDVLVEFADGTKRIIKYDAEDFLKGITSVEKYFESGVRPVKAEIDPEMRLLDINRLNNSSDFFPDINLRINPIIELVRYPRPDEYSLYWLPALGFNNVDGFKLGLNLSGTYFTNRKNIELTFTQGMKFGKNSFGGDISYKDKMDLFGPYAYSSFSYFNYEGRRGGELSLSNQFMNYDNLPRYTINLSAKYFDAYDDRYFYPEAYDRIFDNNSQIIRQRKYFSINGSINYYNYLDWISFNSTLYYESGFVVLPDNQKSGFQKFTLAAIERIYIPFLREIRFRQYAGYSPDLLPNAKSYYRSTVNPIEEFSSWVYRTPGIISNTARQKRSIPNGGGYLRGYYNQNIPGNIAACLNAEMSLRFLLKPIPIINNLFSRITWLFADAGNVWNSTTEMKIKDVLLDYGISIKIPLGLNATMYGGNMFSFLTKMGINSINFDFPFYVSNPIDGEKKLKFRWLFGFQSPL